MKDAVEVCPRKAPRVLQVTGQEDLDKCSLDRMELEPENRRERKEGRQAGRKGRTHTHTL